MASYHVCVKSGKKGKAENHAAYIAREGKHSKEGQRSDLVATGYGNLPEWANGNPSIFWRAADRNERVNGAAYRELEIALPSELNNAQNLELIADLIRTQIGDKPFQFAMHAPNASLGKVVQPHLHAMFSDRIPDGICRTPEVHFKRFNPANPSEGGCKKDSGGKEKHVLKAELISCRESIATIQNAHLKRHGHAERVDHRSNAERGIKWAPERHLGQSGIRKLDDEAKLVYQDQRHDRKRDAK